jgi:hypothetical protein
MPNLDAQILVGHPPNAGGVRRNVAALVKAPRGKEWRPSKELTLDQGKALLHASQAGRSTVPGPISSATRTLDSYRRPRCPGACKRSVSRACEPGGSRTRQRDPMAARRARMKRVVKVSVRLDSGKAAW